MDKNETSAITFGNEAKMASLFFDSIVPMTAPSARQSPIPKEIILNRWYEFMPSIGELQKYLDRAETGMPKKYNNTYLHKSYLNENILGVKERLSRKGIISVPIFVDAEKYNNYGFEVPAQPNAIEIEFQKIPMINAENLEWGHILEVREDKKFAIKARKFRLFLYENYQGKSQAYIQDSLYKKIDDYEEACKKHGLELTLSTLKTTLESKSLLATFSTATAAILLGQPFIAGGAIVAGASIELGKMAINIAEKRLELRTLKNSSDVSYLFDLKEKGILR